jgi:glycine hydroxymethyltransferase
MVLNVSEFNLDTRELQQALDEAGLYTNRNAIPNDPRPPFNPSGLRVGSPAITTRGFKEKDATFAARLVAQIIKNFNDARVKSEVKKEVQKLAKKFPIYKDFKW